VGVLGVTQKQPGLPGIAFKHPNASFNLSETSSGGIEAAGQPCKLALPQIGACSCVLLLCAQAPI
jgi:hypothetical protein